MYMAANFKNGEQTILIPNYGKGLKNSNASFLAAILNPPT